MPAENSVAHWVHNYRKRTLTGAGDLRKREWTVSDLQALVQSLPDITAVADMCVVSADFTPGEIAICLTCPKLFRFLPSTKYRTKNSKCR